MVVQRRSLPITPLQLAVQPGLPAGASAGTAAEVCGQCAALLASLHGLQRAGGEPAAATQQPSAAAAATQQPSAAAAATQQPSAAAAAAPQQPSAAATAAAAEAATAEAAPQQQARRQQQQQQPADGRGLWRAPPLQGRRCSGLDDLLADRTTLWSLETDGGSQSAGGPDSMPQWRLGMRDCALLRFSGRGARACLKDRTLVFVGDSVTRCVWWPGRGQRRLMGGAAAGAGRLRLLLVHALQPAAPAQRAPWTTNACPPSAPTRAHPQTPMHPRPATSTCPSSTFWRRWRRCRRRAARSGPARCRRATTAAGEHGGVCASSGCGVASAVGSGAAARSARA